MLTGGRTVVGLAAKEGLEYGIRVLELLRAQGAETHLVLTDAASSELGDRLGEVSALADRVYATGNQAARISSGSFLTRGMIVAPCDGGSLAAIAMGLATNLVYRAADVTLKEGRPLVLGLTGATDDSAGGESLARAEAVPGLVTLRLRGPVDDVASGLLAALEGRGHDLA